MKALKVGRRVLIGPQAIDMRAETYRRIGRERGVHGHALQPIRVSCALVVAKGALRLAACTLDLENLGLVVRR